MDENASKPYQPFFYHLEMQNGKSGGGNIFRRHFSFEDFGSLETVLIFWVSSIATLFIGGWIILMSQEKIRALLYPLVLFTGVFVFSFLKWLFALMCFGHLSNAGYRPMWLEIISDLMGGLGHSILVAVLLLMASGYSIINKDPGKRMKIAVLTTAAIYTTVQSICGFTTTLTFDSGRTKYVYQSPTGYTLVTLNVTAWLVFLLVAMYTNTHWPTKRCFYLQLIGLYTVWFWTLPIILIINGEHITLWRRTALHRSIASTMDLVAHVYLLYLFWPSNLNQTFIIYGDNDDGGADDSTSLTAVPRTSVTPVNAPTLPPDPKSPRKKQPKAETPKPSTSKDAPNPEPAAPSSSSSNKDTKSNFLKKLMQ